MTCVLIVNIAVCISLSTNTLDNGLNPTILTPTSGK